MLLEDSWDTKTKGATKTLLSGSKSFDCSQTPTMANPTLQSTDVTVNFILAKSANPVLTRIRDGYSGKMEFNTLNYNRIVDAVQSVKPFQNFDYKSFLLKRSHRGNVLIPHAAMKRITSLYQTTSDYADNFAVVDKGKQKQKTYQCLD